MSITFTKQHPLRVAIIGGGIGGLCVAISLLKHPHIDVQVYEAAASFGEIGAGVMLGPNALHALDLVGPDARAAFEKHATGNLWPKYATSQLCYVVVCPSSPLVQPLANEMGPCMAKASTKAN